MKTWLAVIGALTLAACGVETASTAATVAAQKKAEIEEAQKSLAAFQQKLDLAQQQMQQQADQANQQIQELQRRADPAATVK